MHFVLGHPLRENIWHSGNDPIVQQVATPIECCDIVCDDATPFSKLQRMAQSRPAGTARWHCRLCNAAPSQSARHGAYVAICNVDVQHTAVKCVPASAPTIADISMHSRLQPMSSYLKRRCNERRCNECNTIRCGWPGLDVTHAYKRCAPDDRLHRTRQNTVEA